MTFAYDYRRKDSDSPYAMAFRMAGYVKDAEYISRYVASYYGEGTAPTAAKVRQMQAEHARKRADFARPRCGKDAIPTNDNGEPFRVKGLV